MPLTCSRKPNFGLILWLTIVISALGMTSARAQSPLAPIFSEHHADPGNLIVMELQGPWSELSRDAAAEPEPRAATLTMTGLAALPIEVKPRGKSRRRSHFCKFPPLWLDLPKKAVVETPLHGLNKVKLVTHCSRLGPNSKAANDRLWSEYLLYRIFNMVTDHSLRVRGLMVTYSGQDGDSKGTHPGFLIEHKKSLAARLELIPLKQPKIAKTRLALDNAATVALFQYFAGGTDYSLVQGPAGDSCCHNTVPMHNAQQQVVSVAYDFDATGFVDPPYGGPMASLRIERHTQRLYRGYCQHNAENAQVVAKFFALRESIETLLQEFPHISKTRRKKLLRFTAAFYKRLKSPEHATDWLAGKCR